MRGKRQKIGDNGYGEDIRSKSSQVSNALNFGREACNR